MAIAPLVRNYYVIGSDLVAEVVAVGRNVTEFRPGDRVIPNNAYPESGVEGLLPGVATNHGSQESLILHKAKLFRIPESMPDSVAAGFTIGAQTTYSMIRRLALQSGDRVLLTAPRSNTALFALATLRNHPVEVFGLARSDTHSQRLTAAGMKDLFVIDPVAAEWYKAEPLYQILKTYQGFTAVIDPFADVYMEKSPQLLAMGGRYVFCGLADQQSQMTGTDVPLPKFSANRFMLGVLMKNISVLGNCIGLSEDLAAAVHDYENGRLDVAVDSVMTGTDVGAFLHRTYLDRERFGKVVFHYD